MADRSKTGEEKWPSYTMVDPRMRKIYFQFYQETYKPSALDRKTKELVAIAASLASHCKGCLEGHIKKALKFGATKEELSETIAITNAVSFIRAETEGWIRARMEGFWDSVARSTKQSLLAPIPVLAKSAQLDAPLAKALHCLQDSFSPAHVLRSEVDGNLLLGSAKKNASPACYESGPPIRSIFDYNHPHDEADVEAKEQHDANDYYSGSPEHAPANAAAYASAELIRVALDSIARRQSNNTAWAQFTSRWLSHRLRHDAPGKPLAPVDLNSMLQRSCSPSKTVCGRCAQ
jgi:AhpD family alkylhydroperoxidase